MQFRLLIVTGTIVKIIVSIWTFFAWVVVLFLLALPHVSFFSNKRFVFLSLPLSFWIEFWGISDCASPIKIKTRFIKLRNLLKRKKYSDQNMWDNPLNPPRREFVKMLLLFLTIHHFIFVLFYNLSVFSLLVYFYVINSS